MTILAIPSLSPVGKSGHVTFIQAATDDNVTLVLGTILLVALSVLTVLWLRRRAILRRAGASRIAVPESSVLTPKSHIENASHWRRHAPATSSFVGRDTELRQLQTWLAAPEVGIVLVTGNGGIGKSTLAAELCEIAAAKFRPIWIDMQLVAIPATLCQEVASQCQGLLRNNRCDDLEALLDLLENEQIVLVLDHPEACITQKLQAQTFEEYKVFFSAIQSRVLAGRVVILSEFVPARLGLDAESSHTRHLALTGVGDAAVQELVSEQGLNCDEREAERWRRRTVGNPLLLRLSRQSEAPSTDSAPQIPNPNGPLDIEAILHRHQRLLSPAELEILYWHTLVPGYLTAGELTELVGTTETRKALAEILAHLLASELLKKNRAGDGCGMHELLRDYFLNDLRAQFIHAIANEQWELLDKLPLLLVSLGSTREGISRDQLLQPVAAALTESGPVGRIELRLRQRLQLLQTRTAQTLSYAAGNLINLLIALECDLTGNNFSNLHVAEADLRLARLHGCDFSFSNLERAMFAQPVGALFGIAFSHDGHWLATGSDTGAVRLYEFPDCAPVKTLRGHSSWVTSVTFSPDNKTLASSGDDGLVHLWEVRTGLRRHTLVGHRGRVWSVAISPDGRLVASASADRTVVLWDAATGAWTDVLRGNYNPIKCLAFHPSGHWIATGGQDGLVKIWSVSSRDCTHTFKGHQLAVWSLAFNPEGTILASASDDKSVKLWDIEQKCCVETLDDHDGRVWAVAFSHDGRRLISAGTDRQVTVWDVASGERRNTFYGHVGRVRGIATHPDGDTFATCDDEQAIRCWSLQHASCVKQLHGAAQRLTTVAFHSNRQALFTGDASGQVALWSNAGKREQTRRVHNNAVAGMAWSYQENCIVSVGDDGTVYCWRDDSEGASVRLLTESRAHSAMTICENYLALAPSNNHALEAHDLRAQQRLWVTARQSARILTLAFDSKSELLASSAEDGAILIYLVASGECRHRISSHPAPAGALTWSSNGRLLASGGIDGAVQLWDAKTPQPLEQLSGHEAAINHLVFSHDSRLLASASDDETVRIWEIATGEAVATLRLHQGAVRMVTFNANDQLLATCGDDGRMHIVDANTFSVVVAATNPRQYEGMNLTGAMGLNKAQRQSLRTLGAEEEPGDHATSLRS